LKWGPLCGLKSPRFPENDFEKLEALRPDDDRLSAAVSPAGFGIPVQIKFGDRRGSI
jgi:hypothetical protein